MAFLLPFFNFEIILALDVAVIAVSEPDRIPDKIINRIINNNSFGIGLIGLDLLLGEGNKYDVDPIPQSCWIYNNIYEGNGSDPAGIVVESGFQGADLLWDVTGYDNSWDEPDASKLPPILPNKDWSEISRLANWRLWRFLTRMIG